MKYGITLLMFIVLLFINQGNAYLFGLKSADNTIQNIQQIEAKYNLHLPLVSFIFDKWTIQEQYIISHLTQKLGPNRIYHITLSPQQYTACEVADGIYDHAYKSFFRLIKQYDLQVIFRTMHEMNGGRYPRSSNPKCFQRAWIHVRQLSRQAKLDHNNILFSFSVNHRDAPTQDIVPHKQSKTIFCDNHTKQTKKCLTFEDYRPGDEYVDLVGVSFYNRGKASYDRKWLTPQQIMDDPLRYTMSRLKYLRKPIMIDEVGTTAVWYPQKYNFEISQTHYGTDQQKKNERLVQLQHFLLSEPTIIGAIYFNTDFTNGLTKWSRGEADWSAINIKSGRIYTSIFHLFNAMSSFDKSKLLQLFDLKIIKKHNGSLFVHPREYEQILRISKVLKDHYSFDQSQNILNKRKKSSFITPTQRNMIYKIQYLLE